MKTKIRTTLLTVVFFFGLLTSLQAQDKYEFAVVRQLNNIQLAISIEGKEIEYQNLPKPLKPYYDNTYLFTYISKMQAEGWEVFNSQEVVNNNSPITTFFLRKKKN